MPSPSPRRVWFPFNQPVDPPATIGLGGAVQEVHTPATATVDLVLSHQGLLGALGAVGGGAPRPRLRTVVKPRGQSVGKSAVGVVDVSGDTECWDGQIVPDVSVSVCNVPHEGTWQAKAFPHQDARTGFTAKVHAIGPLGAPAAFARVDWQFFYYTGGPLGPASSARCKSGTARLGPRGTGSIKVPGPFRVFGPSADVPQWFVDFFGGPLTWGYMFYQLYRGGQLVADAGFPPDQQAKYLSGFMTLVEDPSRVHTCYPFF